MNIINHEAAFTPALIYPSKSPENLNLLAALELAGCKINNWLHVVMHCHRFASLQRAIVILHSNVWCFCMFRMSEEDKAKVISILEMQVNNLDSKRKGIDVKVKQIEAVMIDHLNSATER
jgi:hypothetical protein